HRQRRQNRLQGQLNFIGIGGKWQRDGNRRGGGGRHGWHRDGSRRRGGGNRTRSFRFIRFTAIRAAKQPSKKSDKFEFHSPHFWLMPRLLAGLDGLLAQTAPRFLD